MVRNYIIRCAAVLLAGLLTFSMKAAGKWDESPAGLPYYSYDGTASHKGDDPAFLLGNYRLNLMTHASGVYQIMSGERILARFNADSNRPNYGKNRATVTVGDASYEMVGLNSYASDPSRCVVETGVGFTRYDYKLPGGIMCSRMISVMPSENVNEGNPLFVVSVTFTNNGKSAQRLSYVEAVSPVFVPIRDQYTAPEARSLRYPVVTEVAFRYLKAVFAPTPQHFVRFPSPEARSRHEVAPQSLFLYSENAFLSINEGELKAMITDFRLRSGASRTFHIVIGLADEDCKDRAEAALAAVEEGKYGAFESLWKRRLPDFSSERDRDERRKLYWNAHMLESSAVYDSYFDETFVPSGADETYELGRKMSNREHLDAILPLCYSNPELAKSALRYVMKHMDYDGKIHAGNEGYGCVPFDSSVDEGLHTDLMYTVAEYLRVTRDYDFLDERLVIYPMASGEFVKVMEVLERCFICSRDASSLKGFLSDRSDVVSLYPVLIEQIKQSEMGSQDFIKALEMHYESSVNAFMETHGTDDVSDFKADQQIALLNGDFLEPSKKREIYDYLLDEGLEDEMYEMEPEILYPLIAGIASFDALDARSMLRKCSEYNLDGPYPGYWSGYSVHPYSWPLYCHYRMTE